MKKEKDIVSKTQVKKDLAKLRANKQFLTILVLLFVSVLFWITVSLISSQSKEEISNELTLLSKPLTPNIDKETLLRIKDKYSYSKEELSAFTIYKILTTRDGKTDKIVPLEITVEDIDPRPTPEPTSKSENLGSLLSSDLDSSESAEQASPEAEAN
jgi:hypothetical protein